MTPTLGRPKQASTEATALTTLQRRQVNVKQDVTTHSYSLRIKPLKTQNQNERALPGSKILPSDSVRVIQIPWLVLWVVGTEGRGTP